MSTLTSTMPPEGIYITTDDWTEPFWQAAKERKLVAPKCGDCGSYRFPPTPFCPNCQSQNTEWPELPDTARIFSFSIVRGIPTVTENVILAVVVEFDGIQDVHVVSNVIDAVAEDVKIGDELSVDFIDIAEGWKLPVFRLKK